MTHLTITTKNRNNARLTGNKNSCGFSRILGNVNTFDFPFTVLVGCETLLSCLSHLTINFCLDIVKLKIVNTYSNSFCGQKYTHPRSIFCYNLCHCLKSAHSEYDHSYRVTIICLPPIFKIFFLTPGCGQKGPVN